MEKTNITIIGAGVIGLSAAASISEWNNDVFLLEKHESFGRETSSRNSEVIHAGIYYPPASLKGKFSLDGNRRMYELCREYSIPYSNCGKLIVAVIPGEEAQLPALLELAQANGAEGVRIIGNDEIRKMEPNVTASAALYCPTSGIVDSHSLMKYFESKARDNGVQLSYHVEVTGIEKHGDGYVITVKDSDNALYSFESRVVINCAGLQADRIASLAGIDIDAAGYRLYYKKGIYYRVVRGLQHFPKMLIYPVPPAPGSVGIHTTPDLAGGMRLGPHDYWVEEIEYSVDNTHRQFVYDSVKPFLPFLGIEEIQPDTSGIHPKVQKPGEQMRDFIISDETDKGLPGLINLIGIESPGLTSSPAIGPYVSKMAEIYF